MELLLLAATVLAVPALSEKELLLLTLKGVPVWNPVRSESCQPPSRVCAKPGWGKSGKSYTALASSKCVSSKLEVAYELCGSRPFKISCRLPPSDPSSRE